MLKHSRFPKIPLMSSDGISGAHFINPNRVLLLVLLNECLGSFFDILSVRKAVGSQVVLVVVVVVTVSALVIGLAGFGNLLASVAYASQPACPRTYIQGFF